MEIKLNKNTENISTLFNQIADRYDAINSILSFGLDKKWRSKCIPFLPEEKGINILDIACGSCAQMIAIAKKRKDCIFSGIDISDRLLEIGKKKINTCSIQIEKLVNSSALSLPFEDNSFSAATISFGIRNMKDFDKALEETYRILKKNGKIFVLEFSLPDNSLQKKLSLFYLKKVLPSLGNLLSNHSYAYTYLNESIVDFPYGKNFVKHMEGAMFEDIKIIPMTFGMVTLYIGEKK